jgi:hypothetical protein
MNSQTFFRSIAMNAPKSSAFNIECLIIMHALLTRVPDELDEML